MAGTDPLRKAPVRINGEIQKGHEFSGIEDIPAQVLVHVQGGPGRSTGAGGLHAYQPELGTPDSEDLRG